MDTQKKAQALDDDMLESIGGGIELRGYYHHSCLECNHTWDDAQRNSSCPSCGSNNTSSWPHT